MIQIINRKFWKPRLIIIVGSSILCSLAVIVCFPTVFWNVRPAWLNTLEVMKWDEQNSKLSQSQLRILRRIIVENYSPQSMIRGYAFDALGVHMNHQEDSIVSELVSIINSSPDDSVKAEALLLLRKVSSDHELQAITVFRSQLLNDDHKEGRSAIIHYSVDGLFRLDPSGSLELVKRFTKDSDREIASHALYIVGLIEESSKEIDN